MSRLVVVVRDGMVEQVVSDNPDDEILVLDYDNKSDDPEAFENWEPEFMPPNEVVKDMDDWVSQQVFP